jgi:preprotein translocase subunit YajC|tara:strand:+ start:5113 stop:5445 length:333 start_codon:yes stop_codon:yes gene_type:complete
VDLLYAAAQPGQGGGGITAFLPFILIMFIIYFLMIRPQTKRQKEKETMRADLKKGDKIITMGGIYGTVQGFKEKGRQAIIKIDNNTNITINKTAVAGLAEKIKDTELEQT